MMEESGAAIGAAVPRPPPLASSTFCCSAAMSFSACSGSLAPLSAALTLVFSMSMSFAYSGTFHMSRSRGTDSA